MNLYPSPGVLGEYIYSSVALVDLPGGSAGLFGVEGGGRGDADHVTEADKRLQIVGRDHAQLAGQGAGPLHVGIEHGRQLDIGQGRVFVCVIAAEYPGPDHPRPQNSTQGPVSFSRKPNLCRGALNLSIADDAAGRVV